jgi:methyl coenzyme M reductase subunit C-like uncharacterized protein (methanogenesis marker protein 7)
VFIELGRQWSLSTEAHIWPCCCNISRFTVRLHGYKTLSMGLSRGSGASLSSRRKSAELRHIKSIEGIRLPLERIHDFRRCNYACSNIIPVLQSVVERQSNQEVLVLNEFCGYLKYEAAAKISQPSAAPKIISG